MSAVGFDLGNQKCVIAAARKSGIDVLLDKGGDRETPAVICFAGNQRQIGSAGAHSATSHPKSTVTQLKRLVGRRFEEIEDELRFLPFDVSRRPAPPDGDDGGEVEIRFSFGNKDAFTPFQLLVMLLSHLAKLTSLESPPVSNCVIGVPAYFTNRQRTAYLEAAKISGLKQPQLMHEGTAVALGYGMYRDFPPGGPTTVVFVDVGHCDTQVTVALFWTEGTRILAHAFDSNLGGRDFDDALYQRLASKFEKENGVELSDTPRACVRLRKACEDAKRVLSVNAEASVTLECLVGESDLSVTVRRECFEAASAHLLDKLTDVCYRAAMDARLTKGQPLQVELVGSGSRIPAISRRLAEFFQLKGDPSRTLNASECIARGCALQSARLSPNMKVKSYEVQDIFPFSVAISTGFPASDMLFGRGCRFPFTEPFEIPCSLIQQIQASTFDLQSRPGTFYLQIHYANKGELPPKASQEISSLKVHPLQDITIENTKLEGKLCLNMHGIILIEQSSIRLNEETTNFQVSNGASQFFFGRFGVSRFFGSHDGNDSRKTPEKSPSKKRVPNNDDGGPILMMIDSSTEEEDTKYQVHRMEHKVKYRQVEFQVAETINGGMTSEVLVETEDLEKYLEHHDREMERLKEAKNSLEAFVFDIRKKLAETYQSSTTESERKKISDGLELVSEYLYKDKDEDSVLLYSNKMKEIKKLVEPIERKYKQQDKLRAVATTNLWNLISYYKEGVNHLASSVASEINNKCNEAEQWLREMSRLRNPDLVKLSDEIVEKSKMLNLSCLHLLDASLQNLGNSLTEEASQHLHNQTFSSMQNILEETQRADPGLQK